MNNNFNNQSQMGADFTRTKLASGANKVAKIIQITAIVIITSQILGIILAIMAAPLMNDVAALSGKASVTTAEANALRDKALALAPLTLLGVVAGIVGLVFIIIAWVRQNKLNKELVLAGLNQYQVYPVVLIVIYVAGIVIGQVAARQPSLAMVVSIVFAIVYIVVAVLMLKQAQQMKKDFNQNA
jgi:hypothetical protein